MAKTMQKTSDVGIYFRENTNRRHNGKPDRTFYIVYKQGQRVVWEKVGALSEGITKGYAASLRRQRLEAIRKGSLPTRKMTRVTFNALYEQWRTVHLPTLKDKGITNTIEKHLLPAFGTLFLREITRIKIERFKAQKLLSGLKPATVTKILGALKRILHKAKAWGLLSGDLPTDAISLPPCDQQRDRYLTHEEARNLLAELARRSMLWHDIALLSLHTGLRLKNCLELRGKQIDFAAKIINVPQAKGGYYVATATDECLAMLRQRYAAPNALIFPSPVTGKQMYGSTSAIFPAAVKACGLNDGLSADDVANRVCFHTLRHTFASWIAQGNVSMSILRPLLGHKSERMTQRYAKLAPHNARHAVELISQAFHDGEPK